MMPELDKVIAAAKVGNPITLHPITMAELQAAQLTPKVIVPNLLFADVRTRVAAGGVSKTTMAVYEAVTGALGRPLWGNTPARPIKTVFITKEDSRPIIIARLREVIKAQQLTEAETVTVIERIAVVDLSGESFRLAQVRHDVVEPDRQNIGRLFDCLEAFEPDWIVIDPLVSFGVGEARVNDSEQALIEAMRIIRNRLECCVEAIHHVGKANAREKATDQYAGRGGSALADGARMVCVLNRLNPDEWAKATGSALPPDGLGILMTLPKMTYCTPQADVYILRTGFRFEQVQPLVRSAEQTRQANVEQVCQFVTDQYQQGSRYSKNALESLKGELNLTRTEIREAVTKLIASGRLGYCETGRTGNHHLYPMDAARFGEVSQK
jgi:RecA-family ATPase